MTRVFSLNTKDAFGSPKDGVRRAPRILNIIDEVKPTIAVLSEAYDVHYKGGLADIRAALEERQYVVTDVDQDKEPYRKDRRDLHGLVVISKESQTLSASVVPLVSRYAIHHAMQDEDGRPFDFFGQHGNDSNEALRYADGVALGEQFDFDGQTFGTPTILAGDLNTADRTTLQVPMRVARAIRPVVDLLPSSPPDPEHPPRGLKRLTSLGQRLGGMAIGRTYQLYTDTFHLENTDPSMQPTIDRLIFHAKIDHILASDDFVSSDPRVYEKDAGAEAGLYPDLLTSDHRGISARMQLKP